MEVAACKLVPVTLEGCFPFLRVLLLPSLFFSFLFFLFTRFSYLLVRFKFSFLSFIFFGGAFSVFSLRSCLSLSLSIYYLFFNFISFNESSKDRFLIIVYNTARSALNPRNSRRDSRSNDETPFGPTSLHSSIPPKFKNRVARLIELPSKHARRTRSRPPTPIPELLLSCHGTLAACSCVVVCTRARATDRRAERFHEGRGWLDAQSLHQPLPKRPKKIGFEGHSLNEMIDNPWNELTPRQTRVFVVSRPIRRITSNDPDVSRCNALKAKVSFFPLFFLSTLISCFRDYLSSR